MSERFKLFAAAYVILIRNEEIFLLRRYETGWMDGYYGLPSGHLEEEEGIKACAIREAQEEAGIYIRDEDLDFAHVMHRVRPGDREYIDMYFVARAWQGEPSIMEVEKADDGRWFPISSLPENTVPSVRYAIDNYRSGVAFSTFGRDEDQ